MNRRRFLAGASALAGVGLLRPVVSLGLETGDGPFGPLSSTPDPNGLLLPERFSSRVIVRGGELVQGTAFVAPIWPDGAHCFTTGDGGWIHVLNSEVPTGGGAWAVRYTRDGEVVDAYGVLTGTRNNCAGGHTPWGTWLSCEEVDDGLVYECDPTGRQPARVLPGLGTFKHEAAAIDAQRRHVYLSEDAGDGRFYRFTPAAWPDLAAGRLEAAEVSPDGVVTWHAVPDPAAASTPTRAQVPQTTAFDGGEGCFFSDDTVLLTTKGDDRVWAYDVERVQMRVLYDASTLDRAPLTGVDNVTVHAPSGDVLVAEDGGNMEIVLITPDGVVAPLVRAPGPEHGTSSDSPVPTTSEITGLAFSPDGTRLYFNSQRGGGRGITYEVRGPFRTARSGTPAPPTTTIGSLGGPVAPVDAPLVASGGELPASGLTFPVAPVGVAAIVGAVVALRARGASQPTDE